MNAVIKRKIWLTFLLLARAYASDSDECVCCIFFTLFSIFDVCLRMLLTVMSDRGLSNTGIYSDEWLSWYNIKNDFKFTEIHDTTRYDTTLHTTYARMTHIFIYKIFGVERDVCGVSCWNLVKLFTLYGIISIPNCVPPCEAAIHARAYPI